MNINKGQNLTTAIYRQTPRKHRNEWVNRYRLIRFKLEKLFWLESQKENSIFISYSDSIIEKIAKFLLEDNHKSIGIGIAGETASGKSTIAYDLISVLLSFARHYELEDFITRVNSDDYYYDRSEMVKEAGGFDEFIKFYDLDVPQALELDLMKKHIDSLLNNKSVMLPKYDLSGTTIRIDNAQKANPARIIISEGLFVLTEDIADAFDIKIYVHTNTAIQKKRFYERAKDRGMLNSADILYNKAKDRAATYILPTRHISDIVLSGEAKRTDYKNFLIKFLALVEEFSNSI